MHVHGEWEPECAWGQVGRLSAGRISMHSWAERNQLNGEHGAWGTDQTGPVPWLRVRFIFHPIRWWKSHIYTQQSLTTLFSNLWLQFQAGAEPVGNSSVPGGGWCEEGGTQDVSCLWWRQTLLKTLKEIQWNHTELGLYCKRPDLENIKVKKSVR